MGVGVRIVSDDPRQPCVSAVDVEPVVGVVAGPLRPVASNQSHPPLGLPGVAQGAVADPDASVELVPGDRLVILRDRPPHGQAGLFVQRLYARCLLDTRSRFQSREVRGMKL